METEKPDLEKFELLKKNYSFNENALKDKFVEVGEKLTSGTTLYAKQICFMQFRELCGVSGVFPKQLFTFTQNALPSSHTLAIKRLITKWESKPIPYSNLTQLLEQAYPGVPWIVDYFVTCTFPSLFGHFMAQEYAEAAVRFMISQIEDPIAPRLVGSFLMHNFMFRERLMHAFSDLWATREEDKSTLAVFEEALGFCASYLSPDHLRLIQILHRVNPTGALLAICRYFLAESVRSWQFSPLFQKTNTILTPLPPMVSEGRKFEEIEYMFVLYEELYQLPSSPKACAPFLDIFLSTPSVEMPMITPIRFQGGVKFFCTVIDIALAFQLLNYYRQLNGENPSKGPAPNPANAANDAFCIYWKCGIYLDGAPQPPESKEKEAMTLEKLMEKKIMHDFLADNSAGIKQLRDNLSAIKNQLELSMASFAEKLFKAEPELDPVRATMDQKISYAWEIFTRFTGNNKKLLTFIEKKNGVKDAKAVQYHRNEIVRMMQNHTMKGKEPEIALLDGVSDYINYWRQKQDEDEKAKVPSPRCQTKDEIPLCKYYVKIVDRYGFALCIRKLSMSNIDLFGGNVQTSVPSGMTQDMVRRTFIEYFVNQKTVDKFESDPAYSYEIEIMEESALDAKCLVQGAVEVMKNSFNWKELTYGVGEYILYFDYLSSIIKPYMSDEPEDAPLNITRVVWLFGSEMSIFFRAMLITCISVLQEIRVGASEYLPKSKYIPSVFDKKLYESLDNLRKWFGFSNSLALIA